MFNSCSYGSEICWYLEAFLFLFAYASILSASIAGWLGVPLEIALQYA